MQELMSDILVAEYETIIAEVGKDASDDQIVAALVRDADWTEQAARDLLHLAQSRGVFMLRNALALANALEIEDGDLGF